MKKSSFHVDSTKEEKIEGSVLDALSGERIVSFEQKGSEVVARECCDDYFEVTLTKEEFGRLIAELQALHARM